jgi:C4-dicarboxylate-specific signal transduction histidine kinase
VSDGGAGLSPEDFFRFGDPYRHAGGAREGRGNGVALARGIMRALGGALEVATFPGRGTVVYLLLPPAEGGDWLLPGTGPVGEVAWPEC